MLIEKTLLPGRGVPAPEWTSPAMDQLRQVIRQVAPTQATILIRGEFGTGKRLVAAAIHRQSPRAEGPFYRADCAASSAAATEGALFGAEKTAGTGSPPSQEGLLELAGGGTLLLQEIAEISPAVQARLLRVLQDGTFERVGGKQSQKSDVRLLATTNRELEAKVRSGEFREDLFLRMNIVPVRVPPLRDRQDDIALLSEQFRTACARRLGIDAPSSSSAGLSALESHPWPGNVRELRHRIELAVLAAGSGGLIEPAHLGFAGRASSPPASSAGKDFVDALPEMEKRHILEVLDRCKWNRGNAALRLGISIRTLRNKLKEYANARDRDEDVERQP